MALVPLFTPIETAVNVVTVSFLIIQCFSQDSDLSNYIFVMVTVGWHNGTGRPTGAAAAAVLFILKTPLTTSSTQ